MLTSLTQAAVMAWCGDVAVELDPALGTQLFSAQGNALRLLVDDSAVDSAQCDVITLDVSIGEVQWASPLPVALRANEQPFYTLTGEFSGNDVSISEISGRGNNQSSGNTAQTSLLGRNLLPAFERRVFGSNERARWINGNQLQCDAGSNIAGVQLLSPRDWPNNFPLQLQITVTGQGVFDLAIADADRIANQSPLSLGEIGNTEDFEDDSVSLELPVNNAPWSALTLVCPESASNLIIESIMLRPVRASTEERASNRAAWVWSSELWLDRPTDIWAIQELYSLNELFITIPVDSAGVVVNSGVLAEFVSQASQKGVAIWPVIGDPRDVLPESLEALLTRVLAYKSFNAGVEQNARLSGVQLDIEPYLLPGFNLGTDYWRERYLVTLRAVFASLEGQLPVDLVVPFWFGTHGDWGSTFLEQLTMPDLSLTIMNYRTSPELLENGALPFLQWGVDSGAGIRIAMESGSLPDATQRVYVAEEREGELWQIMLGDTPVMVLFGQSQQDLPGTAYAFTSEREFSASNTTFAGDVQALNSLAERLHTEWQRWPTYNGIAIHGLDEIYFRNQDNGD